MELIKGKTLQSFEKCDELGKIRISIRYLMVKSLIEGVISLHQHGYCHNDLNISNIIITNEDISIIDFSETTKLNEYCVDNFKLAYIIGFLYRGPTDLISRSLYDILTYGKNLLDSRSILKVIRGLCNNVPLEKILDIIDENRLTRNIMTDVRIKAKGNKETKIIDNTSEVFDHNNIEEIITIFWPNKQISFIAVKYLEVILLLVERLLTKDNWRDYFVGVLSVNLNSLLTANLSNRRYATILNYLLQELIKDAGVIAELKKSPIITIGDVIERIYDDEEFFYLFEQCAKEFNYKSLFEIHFDFESKSYQRPFTSEIEIYSMIIAAGNNPYPKMTLIGVDLRSSTDGIERYTRVDSRKQSIIIKPFVAPITIYSDDENVLKSIRGLIEWLEIESK